MKRILIGIAAAAVMSVAPAVYAAEPEGVDELNELLRGELSAVETYKQAMEKVSGLDLEKALKDHEMAVKELTEEVRKAGGTPSQDSGVWGVWTQAVTGTAKALGKETALQALKQGEEHGIEEYQELLEDDDVPAGVKNLVRQKLLPKQKEHIASLDRMIEEG